jgi:hypothetical protein
LILNHSSSFLFLANVDFAIAGLERGEEPAGKCPPPDSDPFNDAEFGKNPTARQAKSPPPPSRRFEFHKRSQLFIRTHNETLSVAAMCVCNKDRSPVGINR